MQTDDNKLQHVYDVINFESKATKSSKHQTSIWLWKLVAHIGITQTFQFKRVTNY